MRSVAARIAQLPHMSNEELQDLWRDVFRNEPPAGFNRTNLIQQLAYQMQVITHGALPDREVERMRSYLKRTNDNIQGRIVRPVAGTVITRMWKDIEHRVHVLEDGFEYNNVKYRSLTQVARKITGTQWSGPVFFGLKNKRGNA